MSKILNSEESFQNIQFRLIIKNIPSNLSNENFLEILQKNFSDEIEKETLIVKLDKRYSMKKRSKVCFITVKNLMTRQKVYDFFSTFELIDPKGIKQKLTVNDCIVQGNFEAKNLAKSDPVINTIDEFEHFKKFKEYFEKEKLADFKNEENKCKKYFIII